MPRAGLSTDLVVEEAARLADEVGYDQLTLAGIAARFGVAVPSLYKHVGGLEDVQGHVALRGVRELGAFLATAPGDQALPREALRAMAVAYRDYARAHPGRYAASLRAPAAGHPGHRAAAEQVLATVLDVLAGYGLAGEDAIDAARTVRSALHGFVALEAAGGFGLPRDVERSFGRLADALDAALASWPAGKESD